MNTPPRPRLKSLTPTTTGPRLAELASPRADLGDPKGVTEGVPTSPDPQATDPGNPTPQRPGIRIFAPPVYRHHDDGARWSKRYSDTPTAAYACPCGEIATATGRDNVAALVTNYDHHRAVTCSLRTPQEGRAAA